MERKFFRLIGIIIIIGTIGFTGCATRPVVITSDEHLVAAAWSAERLAELSGRIGDTLEFAAGEIERIGELARDAGGGIALALRLLDEYDEFVQSLIRRIADLDDIIARGNDAPPADATDIGDYRDNRGADNFM